MEEKQELQFMRKETIEESEKNFDFLVKLPGIITGVLGVLFFIFGVGVVLMNSEAEGGALIWIIGAIICIINYWVMKLSISYYVLHIAYLKEIKDKLDKK